MTGKRTKKVGGLFAALLTPFDSRGRVNPQALAELVRFLIAQGVEGLYPCGSTGLGPLLSIDERKLVAETAVQEARGSVPVVVQVGCPDTGSTVELAKHAEKIGADAVASLTPYYYKPGEREVLRHFEKVTGSVGIPVFAYNIPQFTGFNLTPALAAKMANEGTISGIKDSSRNFLQLLDLLAQVPHGFVVMNGTEEYALFALMMGARGLVSGGVNAFPELFRSVVSSWRARDYTAALSHQQRIIDLKEATDMNPIASYYEVLREGGIDCGVPRAPLLPLEPSIRKQLLARLRRSKVLS